MKEILFVDDEPFVIQALGRMLHGMRRDWVMRFATSGVEALQMLAERPADIVVSDMRMPGMNGAELLNEIMERHPKTVRIILSGYADEELVLQCVGGTHQYLSKPCDGATLRGVIERAANMDPWLNNDRIKSLVSGMARVPSLPALYFKILKELRSPEAAIDRVGAIIAQDPAMTAKMLQLVNSAFFGLHRQLSDPTEAVAHLGMETIKSLVLMIHIFSELEGGGGKAQAEGVYQHSLATAGIAKQIVQLETRQHRLAEECFTAGLLHDIGRLALAANLPEQYSRVSELRAQGEMDALEAERNIFGVTHAEVGGYLLGLWGLPLAIVETAAFHHNPGACRAAGFNALTAVHAANALEHEQGSAGSARRHSGLDRDHLEHHGLWERVRVWRASVQAHQAETLAL